MNAHVAIKHLIALKEEAEDRDTLYADRGKSWRQKVDAVLDKAGRPGGLTIGLERPIVEQHPYATNKRKVELFLRAHFQSELDVAIRKIDNAIFELNLEMEAEAQYPEGSFDEDLWSHVKQHVADENWQAVASQTAIFVEDRVRGWGGEPKGRNGRRLVGADLMSQVLAANGILKLGDAGEASEQEGWRDLGLGFVLAVSNVNRHRIDRRPDAKKYAMGVLGLGSLILTQIRYQHEVDIREGE